MKLTEIDLGGASLHPKKDRGKFTYANGDEFVGWATAAGLRVPLKVSTCFDCVEFGRSSLSEWKPLKDGGRHLRCGGLWEKGMKLSGTFYYVAWSPSSWEVAIRRCKSHLQLQASISTNRP